MSRFYSAPLRERSIAISLSVCVSVCPQAYLWNRCIDLHEIFCADPLWPWLDPPLAALRYVMDDFTFGRNGPYGDAWTAESQSTTASGGVRCL